ncbi:MAG TPA: HNH endonuclease [Acidimicrobiales bacterium]|nr:HNH endonuclease [Acidimicrobiales bacterium]
MAFSEETQALVRKRAHGVCECTRDACPHFGRCRSHGAQFHHKRPESSGGTDETANCQFLCAACHERVHAASKGVVRL